MNGPAHPALRLPGTEGAIDAATWAALVRSPEGIPVLLRDGDGYRAQLGEQFDAPLSALPFEPMQHLARYLPEVGRPSAMRRAIAGVLKRHAPAGASLAIEAGCSVGPDLRALRRHAEHVIAFDSWMTPLRVAHKHLRGEPVDVPVREEGRRFHYADEALRLAPIDGVTLAVGNALDPPLQPESADIALAVNVLDNVSEPLVLLGQLDAVLKPGGLLVLASPFNWIDAITPPKDQLGGGLVEGFSRLGSEGALQALLRGETPYLDWLRYELLETADVPWTVREHARCEVRYRVHVLAARKRDDRSTPQG